MSGRKYLHCAQIIPSLNRYCTFYAQGCWKHYDGDIFDCETEQRLDFKTKDSFQYYTVHDGEVIPSDKLEYLGEITFEFPSEYFFNIPKGTYSSYRHQDGELIIDLDGDIAAYQLCRFGDFKYFKLAKNLFICWHKDDGIERAFITKKGWEEIYRDYRRVKIGFLL